MNKIKALLIAGLLALPVSAQAQSGKLPAYNIWGNPTASSAYAKATTISAIFDAQLSCSGRGSLVMRGTSAWQCLGPGTINLPLVSAGAGADLLFQILTVAGGGTGLSSGTSGGIPYFSASGTMASSAALTANRLVLGGGAGVAPTVLGSLGTTTTVLHGNAAGAPTFGAVALGSDVSGNLPLANIATGTQDTVLGYWGSTAVSAIAVNNCSNALTYSTSTHTFGCNVGAGTGTVTSVTLGAGYGISVTGTNPVTSTGTFTPAVGLSSGAAVLGADVALNNTGLYFDGPSVAQGSTGTWWASGTVTLQDTSGAAAMYCKLWDGSTIISTARADVPATNFYISISLSGRLATPAGNIRISCRDASTTNGKIIFNATGNSTDSNISVLRIQ